jgi:CDP-6-deoxy-D-xylo-4-hexulose-3-dehydrase
MIPLMKNAFLNEHETKQHLADFIIRSRQLSMGEECKKFEENFAISQGCKHSILFNSGGSANLAMIQTLKNLGRLREGDEVGFSALTWSTNVMPIIQMGLVPVAIDCSINTLNVMSSNVEATIKSSNLKAIFITNVLGLSGDIDNIKDMCNAKNIILFEDNCESLGSTLPSAKLGNFGLMSSFSFFVAHHMSTIEGGMVCTSDNELAQMLRLVRANGWDRNLQASEQKKLRSKYNVKSEFNAKYTFYDLAFNLRPTEITGFLGNFQLRFLNESNIKREKNFYQLNDIVLKNNDLIPIDFSHMKFFSSFAFPVICKDEKLKKHYLAQFAGAGIEIRPMIAGNIQMQPFYKKYVKNIQPLPNTDHLHNCSFYCGNYFDLSEPDLQTIGCCISL